VSDYLTVPEVAEKLKLSRMSVYRLLSSGELAYHAFGKAFRVSKAEFEAYQKRSERR